jgi:TonB family protein
MAASLCCLFVPRSTVAFGWPQSEDAGSNRRFPGRDADKQISPSSTRPGESVSRSPKIVISTQEKFQLTLKADCANVQILTGAANEVSYRVRLDAKGVVIDADALLRDFSLAAHNTPHGVFLIGRPSRNGDCRVMLTYKIQRPRRYNLDIAVQSGNIVTPDVDGIVALATGGGNIQAGRVRSENVAPKGQGAAFAAQLQTAGGDVSIGDVTGGLSVTTAGGQISAGDVHGPAVLRTGGGDIHVGHVFGAARFISGGGDISAEKVDGGLWADTAGGRVEIGNAAQAATVDPQLRANPAGAFRSLAPRRLEDRVGASPTSDLADVTELARFFSIVLWGGIHVDPADQQKRLASYIAPEYPDVARLAGIEGDVILRVFVGRDGTIRDVVPLSGPPVLARAAVRSVEQWRYAPALIDGHPVDVITTVTLAFRLHP